MKIKCPACAKILSIPETAAGKVVQCPCGKQLRVPGPSPSVGPTPLSAVPPQPARSSAGSLDADPSAFDELTDQDLQPVSSVGNPYAAPTQSAPGGRDPLQGYAPPAAGGALRAQVASGVRASLGQRIGGALVDIVFSAAIGISGLVMVGLVMGAFQIDPDNMGTAMSILFISLVYGPFFLPIVINAYLISVSGQSVGKKVAKTRIVDLQTGIQSGFVQGFLLRNFVWGIITSIPCIGAILGLADLIMLFPEPHETLHDKLAKTAVVQA